jgi:hypothetical protein
MLMVLLVARSWEIFRFGTKLLRSSMLVMACVWMVSAVTADTVSGTSCRFSLRRRAVTTTSWMPALSPEPSAAAAPVLAVCAGSEAGRSAATADATSDAARGARVLLVM